MALFQITFTVEERNLKSVEKKLRDAFPYFQPSVQHLPRITSRASRLDEAANAVNNALEIVRQLNSEIAEWKDNLPQNLQSTEKADELSDCASALDEMENDLDKAASQFEDINFPGMY